MAKNNIIVNFEGYTGNLIIVWKLASAPLAEVGRSSALPFPVNQTYTIANIQPVVHIIEFWQSANGVTLDSRITSGALDASQFDELVVKHYEYQVGRGSSGTDPNWSDPTPDTQVLIDERLDGATKDQLTVSTRGTGLRHAGEYDLYPGGGIELTGDETFQPEDWVFVTQYQMQTTQATETSSDYDIVEVENDIVFGTEHHNKILVANFSATIGTIDFDEFSTITDTKCKVVTYNGEQRYVKLQFAVGDTVRFMGEDRNVIYLGKDETIELRMKGGVLYVTDYDGDYKHVGEVMTSDKKLINSEYADGTEYDLEDFPRLYEALTSDQIVTYAQYDETEEKTIGSVTKTYHKNRGKFAVDLVLGKIKFPDVRGQSFRVLKHFDGTSDADRMSQGAGGRQAMEIVEHAHDITIPSRNLKNDSNTGPDLTADGSDSRALETETAGGTEQRVDNDGKYAIVRL